MVWGVGEYGERSSNQCKVVWKDWNFGLINSCLFKSLETTTRTHTHTHTHTHTIRHHSHRSKVNAQVQVQSLITVKFSMTHFNSPGG